MRHFHRTTLAPDDVLATADRFFPAVGLTRGATETRSRSFAGALGVLRLVITMDGGHATFVEAQTDQVGESRLDKNVKKFFVALHRAADPRHQIEASY